MRSIKEICLIGVGPSSSHTMGPSNACNYILDKYSDIEHVIVILYGSLAKTGVGHLTDKIIHLRLKDVDHKIFFDVTKKTSHPNTMDIITVTKPSTFHKDRFVSIGGSLLIINGDKGTLPKEIYPAKNMKEILDYCAANNLSLLEYAHKYEEADLDDYFGAVIDEMEAVALRGLNSKETTLPSDYDLERKAPKMYQEFLKLSEEEQKQNLKSYMAIASMAASEENACGASVVCAPTCGSSGVLPGVVSYLYKIGHTRQEIINALIAGSLIGIVCKQNASVSGAECGCQAEVGVAGAIAAATFAAINNLSNEKITLAAEMVIEHSLGLTCDAIEGRVSIPCINRNALFVLKAYDAYTLAKITPYELCAVKLDDAIKVMKRTGIDLRDGYRETAEQGLARLFKEEKVKKEDKPNE